MQVRVWTYCSVGKWWNNGCHLVRTPGSLVSKRADSINAYQDRMAVGRKIVYSASGIGSELVLVSPLIMLKLYWSVVIPKIAHGLEVARLTEQGVQLMEKYHRQLLLLIPGLPQNTPTTTPLATAGWLSVGAFWRSRKFHFSSEFCVTLSRIFTKEWYCTLGECMSNKNISNMPTSSPIADMYIMVCKYGLHDSLRTCELIMSFAVSTPTSIMYLNIIRSMPIVMWRKFAS